MNPEEIQNILRSKQHTYEYKAQIIKNISENVKTYSKYFLIMVIEYSVTHFNNKIIESGLILIYNCMEILKKDRYLTNLIFYLIFDENHTKIFSKVITKLFLHADIDTIRIYFLPGLLHEAQKVRSKYREAIKAMKYFSLDEILNLNSQ